MAALAFNSDSYVELFFAVPWAGGAFAPLNIRWSVAENAYALTDSKSSVLFVDESFIDQARELGRQLPWVKTLIYIGEGKQIHLDDPFQHDLRTLSSFRVPEHR